MPAEVQTAFIEIKIDGALLADDVLRTLIDLETESTYDRPDLCLVRFNLNSGADPSTQVDLGKELEIVARTTGERPTRSVVFAGEVTAVEFEYEVGFSMCVVQAQDSLHRLFRGNKHAVYLNQTYSDVAAKVIAEAGLSADVEATSSMHKHLTRHDETAGDLLTRLAHEVNFHLRADKKKVAFKKIGGGTAPPVELELGENLISLRARATTANQVAKANVRAWDPVGATPKAVVAVQSSPTPLPKSDTKAKSAVSSMGGSSAAMTVAAEGVQADLDKIAQAILDRAAESQLQIEGVCFGNGAVKVDEKIKIAAVSTRFDGEYRVSQVRHRYSNDQGMRTEFACRGGTDQSLTELVAQTASSERVAVGHGHTFDGCAIGVVTNVNDDEAKLGRVKVKFPAFDDALESHWYRLVLPGAGSGGGWFVMPEVNDEVLVIFERNDPRLGYVVGGLYNGKNKPPIELATVVKSGKVEQRGFFTRKKSSLVFDDKEQSESIQLKSATGDFLLRYEEQKGLTITNKQTKNVITVKADGDIKVEAAQGNITLAAPTGKISLSGKEVEVKATTTVKVEGTAGAEMKGATVKIEGQATTTVAASGITEVKGGLVKIN